MNDKERVYNFIKNVFSTNEGSEYYIENYLKGLADDLIKVLYKPDVEYKFVPDQGKIESLGIDMEDAINWGDLRVTSVESFDGDYYKITVEEVSPDSKSLVDYMEYYLLKWGWDNVSIEVEW